MARATKAAAKPAPEPEEDEYELGHYMDKEPSQVHENFAEYVSEMVGYEADIKTIQLVIALYQKFQKTPEQQKFNADKKAASAEAAAARAEKRAAAEKAEVSTPKARTTGRAKLAAVAAEEEEEAPARPARGRRGAAPAAPVKRATSRRRPVPPVDDLEDEG
jgi:hypothetical protein